MPAPGWQTRGPMDPHDDQLMSAYAHGDASAFEALYDRHRAALYRFVRRVLGSAGAAQVDEVAQDTWLRVVQARQRWAPQGASFRTWLFTLAHHRAIDCLRRAGRELAPPAAEDSDGPAEGVAPWQDWPDPAPPAPADRAFGRAAGQRLLVCLDALPAEQRAAFLLHHEDGLSLAELATALGLGFETAKSRLRYAMDKLRACMGAYLPAPGTGAAG